MKIRKQSGFTLVEIAIVLVIIGLLLGGILKGQELINSARVRNLADQNTGIQAAYYGFIDRYRQVPGDFIRANAQTAIGVPIVLPLDASITDGNGRIDDTLEEATAVWEHLAKANFIGGGFTPATAVPTEGTYPANAPLNAFNGSLTLTRNNDYTVAAAAPAATQRLVLHLGTNIPTKIARELDLKVDDGQPQTGILRLSFVNGATWPNLHNTAGAACTIGPGPPVVYNIAGDTQDCGLAFLY